MSDKFFGELLKQYEMLENSAPPAQRPLLQRRQDRSQQPKPQAQANQPGFFGRLKNFAGGEVNRASEAIGRTKEAAINATAAAPGSGRYNPYNRATQWLGDKMGQWGKATPQLDARIKQQNQMNQKKYRESDQYVKDTTDIYKRDQQKSIQKYDDMIKQNNAKLNTTAAPAAPAPVARPQAPVQAPVARPQAPMAASVAPQVQAPAPAPAPYIRPQVNAAAQRVEQLRAEARARNAATAPQR